MAKQTELGLIRAQYEAMGGNWNDVKNTVRTYPLLIDAILLIGRTFPAKEVVNRGYR